MAEGEFALVTSEMEEALGKGVLLDFVPSRDHDLYAVLVDAAAQQRDADALNTYVPLAHDTASAIGHRLYIGIAERASGVAKTLLGDYAAAAGNLQQALEMFRSYPAPWQVARTLFEFAELARHQDRPDRAQRYYATAIEAFDRLGAIPDAARARAAMAGL
jgi:tetratricopeptide (TPR) repeat protein